MLCVCAPDVARIMKALGEVLTAPGCVYEVLDEAARCARARRGATAALRAVGGLLGALQLPSVWTEVLVGLGVVLAGGVPTAQGLLGRVTAPAAAQQVRRRGPWAGWVSAFGAAACGARLPWLPPCAQVLRSLAAKLRCNCARAGNYCGLCARVCIGWLPGAPLACLLGYLFRRSPAWLPARFPAVGAVRNEPVHACVCRRTPCPSRCLQPLEGPRPPMTMRWAARTVSCWRSCPASWPRRRRMRWTGKSARVRVLHTPFALHGWNAFARARLCAVVVSGACKLRA
jgi:hypothetical protein